MKSVVMAFLAACALSVPVFHGGKAPSSEFLSALGLSQDDAESHVFRSFWSDYFSHPTGERVRAVALGDRPALVREVVQFAREYLASPEFLQRYAQARQEARPTPPDAPKSGEEMIQEMKADLEKQIEEMQKEANQAPPDIKAMLLETVGMLKQQLVELDDPDNPYRDPAMQEAFAQGAAAEMADFEARLAEWDQIYPEDPRARIASRLEQTLALCSDVDFSAKLIDGDDGKKLFESTVYERKPSEWKACYRAGPEALDAARAALGEWLAELR